jgi:hypothetical protein
MVEKSRRLRPAQEPGQLKLPPGRLQQIHPSDDMSDALKPVVDGHSEVIRPVAMPIAKQQVSALLGRPLLLQPQAKVVELLCGGVETKADSKTRGTR